MEGKMHEDTMSEELAERLFTGMLATLETFTIYVGVRLGLYSALHQLETATPTALAEAAGIHRRYAREWLEQQAVAGLAERTTANHADPYSWTYRLPEANVPVLLDPDSPYHLGASARFMAGIAGTLPELLEAFRSGEGVPYASYGDDTRLGIAELNRPMYRNDLVEGWLSAMPDVGQRLAEPGARVLDLGCGTGWSTIALAEAFPHAQVHGVDLDHRSIEIARSNAIERGLDSRIVFTSGDAGEHQTSHPYDLVCIFECLHDMADPVSALSTARNLLASDGVAFVADEKVAETYFSPGDEVERLNYAFSVLHCLPATRAEGAVVEGGTVLRPAVVREYAKSARYRTCSVLPIEHDLWRFYRLEP
ncbi:class I SAM-dependent methyltransferase [Streptomyces sp. NPDC093595]|uniref:class I SAM-dependent methyltransferase n=1 Tax=Streptomyces sp. NPDC093595 TaxID=3366045 RepID=UPI00380A9E91